MLRRAGIRFRIQGPYGRIESGSRGRPRLFRLEESPARLGSSLLLSAAVRPPECDLPKIALPLVVARVARKIGRETQRRYGITVPGVCGDEPHPSARVVLDDP